MNPDKSLEAEKPSIFHRDVAFVAAVFLVLLFGGDGAIAQAAFPAGWTRACPITVNHIQVSGTLANFPVLVSYNATTNSETNLPDEMMQTGNPYAAQADGGDIRFTRDAAGTIALHSEIVTFIQNTTLANAKAEIWVNVDNISSATDTTFYVWYHPSSIQATPALADPVWGSQGTWNDSFISVWHLGDGSSLTINDSSHYGNGGAMAGGVTAIAGQTNGGASFDGTSGYLTAGFFTNFDFARDSTVEFWFYPLRYGDPASNCGDKRQCMFSKIVNPYAIQYVVTQGGNLLGNMPARPVTVSVGSAISSLSVWYHAAFVYSSIANTFTLYVNGLPTAQTDTSGKTAVNPIGTGYMGGRNFWCSSTYYQGIMDEVRLSNQARSAAWIQTEYNTQYAPQTFLTRGTPGTPAQPAATTGISAVNGITAMTF